MHDTEKQAVKEECFTQWDIYEITREIEIVTNKISVQLVSFGMP
jgi:hypothetical protein